MIRNYLTVALRSLRKHPGYTAINVVGLAVGMAACLLIALFVRDELSYDRFSPHADRTYRVIAGEQARTPGAVASAGLRVSARWAVRYRTLYGVKVRCSADAAAWRAAEYRLLKLAEKDDAVRLLAHL